MNILIAYHDWLNLENRTEPVVGDKIKTMTKANSLVTRTVKEVIDKFTVRVGKTLLYSVNECLVEIDSEDIINYKTINFDALVNYGVDNWLGYTEAMLEAEEVYQNTILKQQ